MHGLQEPLMQLYGGPSLQPMKRCGLCLLFDPASPGTHLGGIRTLAALTPPGEGHPAEPRGHNVPAAHPSTQALWVDG